MKRLEAEGERTDQRGHGWDLRNCLGARREEGERLRIGLIERDREIREAMSMPTTRRRVAEMKRKRTLIGMCSVVFIFILDLDLWAPFSP